MPPLRRHQLATPSPAGWQALRRQDWADDVRAGLLHWATHRLPLVVTRQPAHRPTPAAPIALGLCLPTRWGRQLVALQLLPSQVLAWHEFPTLAQLLCKPPAGLPTGAPDLQTPLHPSLHPSLQPPLQQACAALAELGVAARVYGSFGWQWLTGQAYVHPHSDLDLWLAVNSSSQADAAADVLHRCTSAGLRIDGELVFTDGSATAWREWRCWRAGQTRSLLVKHLNGAALHNRLWGDVPLPGVAAVEAAVEAAAAVAAVAAVAA